MTQEELNAYAAEMQEAIQQFANGLVTILEFIDVSIQMRRRMNDSGGVAGLLDPTSGLRFPSKEEEEKAF